MRRYILCVGVVSIMLGILLSGCNKVDIDETSITSSASQVEVNMAGDADNYSKYSDYTPQKSHGEKTGMPIEGKKKEQEEMKMNVQIGDYEFSATLENNEAVNELVQMMKKEPISIKMNDYSGFEKVGSLGTSLTTNNKQTKAKSGDIVLYNGNSIVMFYGSNSWSYTKIGKIDDLTNWEKALGSGDITAVFTLKE